MRVKQEEVLMKITLFKCKGRPKETTRTHTCTHTKIDKLAHAQLLNTMIKNIY